MRWGWDGEKLVGMGRTSCPCAALYREAPVLGLESSTDKFLAST